MGPSVLRTLQGMPIGVVNANQVESSKWVVNVFKQCVANVSCVFLVKNAQNICHTRFENINYPLAGLDLVGVDDADGYALERSDNTGTPLN